MNANSPFFNPDAAQVIAAIRALADDLERILANGGPSADDLADAPIIDRWAMVPRMRPALAGIAANHPILGDRVIRTSELSAIDTDRGYARTFSRFYRQGRGAGAARGRDQ
jgi:hypothetical protein